MTGDEDRNEARSSATPHVGLIALRKVGQGGTSWSVPIPSARAVVVGQVSVEADGVTVSGDHKLNLSAEEGYELVATASGVEIMAHAVIEVGSTFPNGFYVADAESSMVAWATEGSVRYLSSDRPSSEAKNLDSREILVTAKRLPVTARNPGDEDRDEARASATPPHLVEVPKNWLPGLRRRRHEADVDTDIGYMAYHYTPWLWPEEQPDPSRTVRSIFYRGSDENRLEISVTLDEADDDWEAFVEPADVRDGAVVLLRPSGSSSCQCDNGHESVDTVCMWCWRHSRRRWTDDDVRDHAPESCRLCSRPVSLRLVNHGERPRRSNPGDEDRDEARASASPSRGPWPLWFSVKDVRSGAAFSAHADLESARLSIGLYVRRAILSNRALADLPDERDAVLAMLDAGDFDQAMERWDDVVSAFGGEAVGNEFFWVEETKVDFDPFATERVWVLSGKDMQSVFVLHAAEGSRAAGASAVNRHLLETMDEAKVPEAAEDDARIRAEIKAGQPEEALSLWNEAFDDDLEFVVLTIVKPNQPRTNPSDEDRDEARASASQVFRGPPLKLKTNAIHGVGRGWAHNGPELVEVRPDAVVLSFQGSGKVWTLPFKSWKNDSPDDSRMFVRAPEGHQVVVSAGGTRLFTTEIGGTVRIAPHGASRGGEFTFCLTPEHGSEVVWFGKDEVRWTLLFQTQRGRDAGAFGPFAAMVRLGGPETVVSVEARKPPVASQTPRPPARMPRPNPGDEDRDEARAASTPEDPIEVATDSMLEQQRDMEELGYDAQTVRPLRYETSVGHPALDETISFVLRIPSEELVEVDVLLGGSFGPRSRRALKFTVGPQVTDQTLWHYLTSPRDDLWSEVVADRLFFANLMETQPDEVVAAVEKTQRSAGAAVIVRIFQVLRSRGVLPQTSRNPDEDRDEARASSAPPTFGIRDYYRSRGGFFYQQVTELTIDAENPDDAEADGKPYAIRWPDHGMRPMQAQPGHELVVRVDGREYFAAPRLRLKPLNGGFEVSGDPYDELAARHVEVPSITTQPGRVKFAQSGLEDYCDVPGRRFVTVVSRSVGIKNPGDEDRDEARASTTSKAVEFWVTPCDFDVPGAPMAQTPFRTVEVLVDCFGAHFGWSTHTGLNGHAHVSYRLMWPQQGYPDDDGHLAFDAPDGLLLGVWAGDKLLFESTSLELGPFPPLDDQPSFYLASLGVDKLRPAAWGSDHEIRWTRETARAAMPPEDRFKQMQAVGASWLRIAVSGPRGRKNPGDEDRDEARASSSGRGNDLVRDIFLLAQKNETKVTAIRHDGTRESFFVRRSAPWNSAILARAGREGWVVTETPAGLTALIARPARGKPLSTLDYSTAWLMTKKDGRWRDN